MNLVRVVYRADDTVAVIHPAIKSRRPGESDAALLIRVGQKAMDADPLLIGRPFEDVNKSTLPPDRTLREKWRKKQGGGVEIDHSFITKAEKRKAVEDDLDAELDKASPDPVKVLKFQRKLDKEDY